MTTYGYQFPNFTDQNRPYQFVPRTDEEREQLRLAEIERKKAEYAAELAKQPSAILGGYYDTAKGALSDFVDQGREYAGPIIDKAKGGINTLVDFYNQFDPNQSNQTGSTGVPPLLDRNNIKPDPNVVNGVPPLLDRNNIRPERYVPAPVSENMGQAGMTDQERAAFRARFPGVEFEHHLTDKKRNRTSFGEFLMKSPGMSDRLIQMGTAMQANSGQGLHKALAAMGQAYSGVNAQQQAAELARMEMEAKGKSDNDDLFNDFQSQVFKYDKALEDFDKIENAGFFLDITGPIDGWIGSKFDSSGLPFSNAEREAFRIRLRKIIVDETLLNTANTKGAISDKEMALFQSSVPTLQQNEEVWREWLQARRDNLIELQERIRSGRTVSRDAEIGFRNTYTIGSNSGSSFGKYEAVDIETN